MTRDRTKILIADDHVLVAEACKNLLEPEFDVVGIVKDGRTLLTAEDELRPQVVIVDVSMPQLNGLVAGEKIKQRHPMVKLIFLTMNSQPDLAAEAFRRGASGYVLKHCSAADLIVAVRRAMRNESYLSPLIPKETVDYLLRSGEKYDEDKRITTRQSEVLQLLAEGKSMKEIAYLLNLKPRTIAFHKYKMMEVLGVTSSAGLIQYAIKCRMVA